VGHVAESQAEENAPEKEEEQLQPVIPQLFQFQDEEGPDVSQSQGKPLLA
jgi:hypothetical protein